jgi:hypothetical protein
MEYYAGIDVSLEQSSVCIVDAKGKIFGHAPNESLKFSRDRQATAPRPARRSPRPVSLSQSQQPCLPAHELKRCKNRIALLERGIWHLEGLLVRCLLPCAPGVLRVRRLRLVAVSLPVAGAEPTPPRRLPLPCRAVIDLQHSTVVWLI